MSNGTDTISLLRCFLGTVLSIVGQVISLKSKNEIVDKGNSKHTLILTVFLSIAQNTDVY